MGESVSQIRNINKQNVIASFIGTDFFHEFTLQYRLLRKNISTFIRHSLQKNFIDILYVTGENCPADYITALQKQYPDKIIKVIMPLFKITDNVEKTSIKINYFLQNQVHDAHVYKIPIDYSNIQVYGIYTDVFSQTENEQDIFDIRYLSHYVKAVRKTALKLKPDIIHADNIPLLMGFELDGRWISGYPIKFIQILHNFSMYKNEEPFWAAINLANKNEMKKICCDNAIKNNLSVIFNTDKIKTYKNAKAYVNYILKKYSEYRKNVNIDEMTRENAAMKRMNERILKMFPKMNSSNENMFNPMSYSANHTNVLAMNSLSEEKPLWANSISNIISVPVKYSKIDNDKIHDPFDTENFRDIRFLNKKYLVREFSEKRIELKFFDINMFKEEMNIRGYFDSFYKAPLFFIPISEYSNLQDIKAVSLAILKAFELRKNIQVIYNCPKNLDNSYLKSLIDFFESQNALNGKWVFLEGKINLPQFMSAADMILIPSGDCYGIEKTLYTALRNGCIPVTAKNCFSANNLSDIFDDLSTGCMFKNNEITEDKISDYESVFFKALEFYNNNSTCWNSIIKNAMNYNCDWDFNSLEIYNNLYDDLL